MNCYELMVIFKPMDVRKIKDYMEKVKAIITSNGAILTQDVWGLRKLAYQIKGHDTGYYVVLVFYTDAKEIREVNRILKLSEIVLKGMVIRRGCGYDSKGRYEFC